MECEEAQEAFSPFLDGELGPEDRIVLEEHLKECSECLRELDGMQRVSELFKAMPAVTAPETFEGDLHEALKPKFSWMRSGGDGGPRYWPLLAAAAILALVAGPYLLFSRPVEAPEENLATAKRYDVEESQLNTSSASAPASQAVESAEVDRVAEAPASPAAEPADEASQAGLRLEQGQVEQESASQPVIARVPSRQSAAFEDREGAAADRDGNAEALALSNAAPVTEERERLGAAPAEPSTEQLESLGYLSDAAPAPARPSRERAALTLETGREVRRNDRADDVAGRGRPLNFFSERDRPEPLETEAKPAEPAANIRDDSDAAFGIRPQSRLSPQFRQDPPPVESVGATALSDRLSGDRQGLKKESGGQLKLGQAFQDSQSASSEVETRVIPAKRIGDLTFVEIDGVWRQIGYKDEQTTALKKDDRTLRTLSLEQETLTEILDLGPHVIFKAGDAWYEITE